MRYRLLLTLAVLFAGSACAQTHFNLTLGVRDEADREERWPAIGIAADFGPARRLIHPEVSLSFGTDALYGSTETEFSAGAIGYWKGGMSRIYAGAGISRMSADYGANSGSSTGLYVHGGLSWRRTSHWMGFDVRYLNADDFTSFGAPFPVGYLQFAFLLGWR